MTSSEIRQSFLDFFKSKQHTIVTSSSLLPDAPNLLFTNAGMNQFVPIFLGQQKSPYSPGRAADTQKCIRAGGKHNDLEDVGLDTYHHTFFEMLGNWSFGDYFKKEAIDWAWELVSSQDLWAFPKERLYATIYAPDKAAGDPSEIDQESFNLWAEKFSSAGLDPKIHVVHGNKKDNFWMMGETGPCGPCSELHVDLTPAGDTKGALVNKGTAECIEIWNLVFIQFNANPDGTFSPLPARHVDTGMGFERVTAILQCTNRFKEFRKVISNYETDVFRPLFDRIEGLSRKQYGSTLPASGTSGATEQEKIDIAFRVIADHCRTLSFAIADGILPGNTDRNYVLRRILRRAVRYGRTLGFHEPFLYKLVEVLAGHMGDVFPEIQHRQSLVRNTIHMEEESFNKTLDRGIELFRDEVATLKPGQTIPGEFAFKLYDTYGFPLDLTQLMARERGLAVDETGFEGLMNEQRERARAAQKKEVITVSDLDSSASTRFVGYDQLSASGRVLQTVAVKDRLAVVLDASPFYAEMGGQVGDAGELSEGGQVWRVANTQKAGPAVLHVLDVQRGESGPAEGSTVKLSVDPERRRAVQRHHTVTHLYHWALHEVVGPEATQKGSYVGPEKLTFDFNSAPLTPVQLRDIERLVNERILENTPVSWIEIPYSEARNRSDILQFFGEKYGDQVRVVQIGGRARELDGYSMELCGGTHTCATGEIGLFRILNESAIAAGVRRIEALAGLSAYECALRDVETLRAVSGKVNAPVAEIEKKLEAFLARQKDLEKRVKEMQLKQAADVAQSLVAQQRKINDVPVIIANLGKADGDFLQSIADSLNGQFKGVVLLTGFHEQAVSIVSTVSPQFTDRVQAGKLVQGVAPIVGGKGGGKPGQARGGGKDQSKLDEALKRAEALIQAQTQ